MVQQCNSRFLMAMAPKLLRVERGMAGDAKQSVVRRVVAGTVKMAVIGVEGGTATKAAGRWSPMALSRPSCQRLPRGDKISLPAQKKKSASQDPTVRD